MADFNLEAMSLKELRQLQKDLAKAISTYEDRPKPAPSWRQSPRKWDTPLPT